MNPNDKNTWIRNRETRLAPIEIPTQTVTLYPIECQDINKVVDVGNGFIVFGDSDKKLGLMNWKGQAILPAVWEGIHPYHEDGVIICRKGKSYVLFDFEGRSLLYPGEERTELAEHIQELLERDGVTVLNSTNQQIICEEIGDFQEGLAIVRRSGKIGYVDSKGRYAMDAPQGATGAVRSGRIAVRRKKGIFSFAKYGYVDCSGKEVIPAIYSEAQDFSEGFAAVKQDGEWNFIDPDGNKLQCYRMNGNERIPISGFFQALAFTNGYARVLGYRSTDPLDEDTCRRWGLINREGRLTAPMICMQMEAVDRQGTCLFHREGVQRLGLIGAEGDILIDDRYNSITQLCNGSFAIEEKDRMGAANAQGRLITKAQWDKVGGRTEEGVSICLDGRWGLLDDQGREILPRQYEREFGLSKGIALVFENGEGRLINRRGETVSRQRFSDGTCLDVGLAMVRMDDKIYMLDYGYTPKPLG